MLPIRKPRRVRQSDLSTEYKRLAAVDVDPFRTKAQVNCSPAGTERPILSKYVILCGPSICSRAGSRDIRVGPELLAKDGQQWDHNLLWAVHGRTMNTANRISIVRPPTQFLRRATDIG